MTGLKDLKSHQTAMSAPVKKPHTKSVAKCVTLEHTEKYQRAIFIKNIESINTEYCSHIILCIC